MKYTNNKFSLSLNPNIRLTIASNRVYLANPGNYL